MKIIIKPEIMARLLCYATATRNEFSGFGYCTREDGNIIMYDFVLMDVGTWGYTETDPKRMLPLFQREDRKNMKIWLHRHPLGDGIPGDHNWSNRDVQTILREPLGSTPEDVGWSVSIVLTPKGFVGRIDNYLKGITQHLEVEPNTADFFFELMSLEKELSVQTFTQPPSGKYGNWNDFPALETSRRKRKKILIGKMPAKSKNGKPSKRKTKTLVTAALSSMKRCVLFVRTSIQRLLPSQISVINMASIGNTSTEKATAASNIVCGGKA